MERKVRYAPINLLSLNDLAWRLGESRLALADLADNIASHYCPFHKKKDSRPYERPRLTKMRLIDNPSIRLKRVQRRIAHNLLGHLNTPEFLYGAVKGKTILDNALLHHGANLIVKMDIKSYYPSVTNDHVYRIWRHELGCSRVIANLLTKLTTYKRHLPQGAPTSSILANIYLASVYGPILRQCSELNIKSSAFVDDIVFSGTNARSLMEPTRKLLGKDGLSFSAGKREILGPHDGKVITGIRLGKDGARAPRKKLSHIRAGLHKLELGLIPEDVKADYVKRLAARISHINNICCKDAAKFIKELERVREAPNLRV